MSSGSNNAMILNGPGQDGQRRSTVRKVASASFLGNFIEWFDYGSYGYLATVVASVFFPAGNQHLALLQTFAVFALSFVLRPVGAIVWGNLGDKRGRRWALSWSILLMSGSTCLIGMLPSHAAIGIAAPLLLLLLRMVQGFSASGEYAGASTFIAEYAPAKRRGLLVSVVPASTAAGLLAASVMVTAMHALLPPDAVNSWAWRVPFLLAGPLGLITRYIRVHLEDSPVYGEMVDRLKKRDGEEPVARPVREVFGRYRRELAISFGVATLNAVGFYLVLSYMPTYLSAEVAVDPSKSFLASTITLAIYIVAIFAMGHLSDGWGRKRMLISACVGFVVLTVPLFWLLPRVPFPGIVAVQTIFCIVLTINDGTLASFLTETFPTRVRYTGFALSFNLANAIFGGTAPFVATWLITLTGNKMAPAYYLVVMSILALGAVVASKEYAGKDLRDT